MPRPGFYKQWWMYFSVLTVSSGNLSMSLAATWTSPTLASLLADSSSGVGGREAALLDCLLPAGAAVSSLLTRPLMDRIGRKQAMILGGLFFLLSWSILACTRALLQVYAARFTAGLAVGILYLASSIYVAEVAPSGVRQMLFAVSQVFTNLGFLLEYCLGPYVHYKTLVLVSAVPSLVYLFCMPFILESPYYLVSKGYYQEAKDVLTSLRGTDDVAAEFKAVQEAVGESMGKSWEETLSPKNRRALWLSCGGMIVKQLTGGWAVTSFAGPLMASGGLSPARASAALGIAKLLTSALTILLVVKFGIKRLVILSLLGIAVALICLFGYFFTQDYTTYSIEGYQWIPLVALALYFVFTDFGIGPFPSFLGAELFSQKARCTGTSLAHATGHVTTVIAMYLITSVDLVLALGVFSVSTLISIPIVAKCMLETRGRSLAEIQGVLPAKEVEAHI